MERSETNEKGVKTTKKVVKNVEDNLTANEEENAADQHFEKTTKKVVKKVLVVEGNFEKVLKDFIDAIQQVNDTGTKEEPKFDFSEAMKHTQLTWKEVAKNADVVLNTVREHVLIGKVHVKVRKMYSDNCMIMLVTTGTGRYSAKMICETAPYKPDPKGTWGVNPLSFHKLPKGC